MDVAKSTLSTGHLGISKAVMLRVTRGNLGGVKITYSDYGVFA